jgi:hypothetical protein
LAFNTRDHIQVSTAKIGSVDTLTFSHLQVPFSESLPVNKDTIMQFIADFLSGKLRSFCSRSGTVECNICRRGRSAKDTEEMAKKQLQTITPINKRNMAKR